MATLPFTGDFFVLRTGLLPVTAFTGWAELDAVDHLDDDDALEAAVTQDRQRLRAKLGEWLANPAISEAIWVASPSLHERMAAWHHDPDSEKGRGVEAAVVRYFARMCGRCTPFGLFAGGSTGDVGEASQLRLPARDAYARHTRLDTDYLAKLAEILQLDHELRAGFVYRPNSSLYHAGGRLRYAEAKMAGRNRSYHLVAVEEDEYLQRLLETAEPGARLSDLVACLVEPDISEEEATEFVHEVIDSQILVTDLEPAVTGEEPIHGMIRVLRENPGAVEIADRLAAASEALDAMDADGLGIDVARYHAIATELEELPAPVEIPRLFQVDMVKPTPQLSLPQPVLDEVLEGASALRRMFPKYEDTNFKSFKEAFEKRYGERRVLLVEALDEESGIGFFASNAPGADASPILDGLAFPARGGAGGSLEPGPAHSLLAEKLASALANGDDEIELTEDDLKRFPPDPGLPLPDAISLMGRVFAESDQAIEAGDFRVYLSGGGGPPASRLLGRFCHVDEELHRRLTENIRREEALEPDIQFAEIVHLPQGRVGNILARPVLRDAEIAFLGRSGLDTPILIRDLTVGIERGRIVLRHRETGQRVEPRMSTAHNFQSRSLGIYRFLCMLQMQRVSPGVSFRWGALEDIPFAPRVRVGRCVVSKARWDIPQSQMDPLREAEGAALLRAAHTLREARRLPRFVGLVEGDNVLPVDLENILSLESFVDAAKRGGCRLEEMVPDETPVQGPDGGFAHEVAFPLVRSERLEAPPTPSTSRQEVPRYAPGSDWLYVKFYCGSAILERILQEVVAPAARDAVERGAADRWFFLRYADPDSHLRARIHGDPTRLLAEVLPDLHARAATFLESGQVWNLQLESYDPEWMRYGGEHGLPHAEEFFHVDSDAAVELVALTQGDDGVDLRWRAMIRSLDDTLAAAGLDLPARHELLAGVSDGFGREFGVSGPFKQQIRDRYRRERKSLDAMLDAEPDSSDLMKVLEARKQRLVPVFEALRKTHATGRIPLTVDDLLRSYLHMHVNRLLRGSPRPQEMVLYHFLERLYDSRLARERAKHKKKRKK